MSRLSTLFRLTRPAVALLLGTALLPVTPGSCQWKPFSPLPLYNPRERGEAEEGIPPPPLPEVIANVFPALCKIQGLMPNGTRIGGGSGFVVSPGGLVATNDHVLSALIQSGASDIVAFFDDGRVYALEPLASDREADIAILKTLSPPTTVFPHLHFASSDTVVRGDTCVVLGAPLGGSLVPAVGVIGGNKHVADDDLMIRVLRSQSDWNLLQVDANMSSGSSGGPIVNDRGEVVGVSVMVQTTGGSGVGSLNYGVASDQVLPIINQLLQFGSVTRAVVGMDIILLDNLTATKEREATGVELLPPPSTKSFAALQNVGEGQDSPYLCGLLVSRVAKGKPGEEGGFKEGDVILEINGVRQVRKGSFFQSLGPVYEKGKVMKCKVWRPLGPKKGGKLITLSLQPVPRRH